MVVMAATDTLLVMAARVVATDVMAATAVVEDMGAVIVPVVMDVMVAPAAMAAAGVWLFNPQWFTVAATAAAAAWFIQRPRPLRPLRP
jgi:hypothetical protein